MATRFVPAAAFAVAFVATTMLLPAASAAAASVVPDWQPAADPLAPDATLPDPVAPWSYPDADSPVFTLQDDGRPPVVEEFTLRLWTLFAYNFFERPGSPSDDAIGFTVEGGLEFGLPTFGRPGGALLLTMATAIGWQGYHGPGPNPTTAHVSLNLLVGYQWRFHEKDSLQFGGWLRFDFAFDELDFDDGSPAIGNDGISGVMAGGFVRYVFRTWGGFVVPVGVFASADLNGGARDFSIGVDLGGLVMLLISVTVAVISDDPDIVIVID